MDAAEYARWFSSEDEELEFTKGQNSQQCDQPEREDCNILDEQMPGSISGNPPKQIPLLPTRGHRTRMDIATSSRGTTEGKDAHSGNANTRGKVMRRNIGEYQGSAEDLIEHIKNIYTGEEQATPSIAREYQGRKNSSLDAPIAFLELYAAVQT
ncbi:hypothetical protein MTO96_036098 [Rhipicephalus appendiculatus]